MRNSASLIVCLSLLGLLLTSCGRAVYPPLPSGEQTVSGVLKPAELSATRRGSFLIKQEGVDVYLAESALINLRQYEGKLITLRGVLEHNTDPQYLPVLVVNSVVDVEETIQEFILSDIGVRLEAPVQWKLVNREGKSQFRLEADEGDPFLVIWQELGDILPDGGVPIVVDATRATRLVDDISGAEIVAVKRGGGKILTLRFSSGNRVNADRLREDFITLLKSIDLLDIASDTKTDPSFGTGSLGNPCGGIAGILCPQGFFCDVQTLEDNVGKCRKL